MNSPKSVAYLAASLLTLTNCGESLPDSEYPPEPPTGKAAGLANDANAKGVLRRADVRQFVDQGLGSFLQRVQLEPKLEQGRFAGFRVLALQPPTFWEGVDLVPGDVVTHVNGQSIEGPEAAFKVFESMVKAKELRVLLRRKGKQRELLFPIVGNPGDARTTSG